MKQTTMNFAYTILFGTSLLVGIQALSLIGCAKVAYQITDLTNCVDKETNGAASKCFNEAFPSMNLTPVMGQLLLCLDGTLLKISKSTTTKLDKCLKEKAKLSPEAKKKCESKEKRLTFKQILEMEKQRYE